MNWIRQFFERRRMAKDLSEEIEQHLEEKIEDLVGNGIPREEAVHAARRAFGNTTLLEERSREVWMYLWVENLLRDVRYALRGFRRHPLFTVTVIATLALGIGATTAVFSVVDPILFRSLPYAHADRLVSLGLVQSLETQEFTLGSFFFDWAHDQKPFEAITSEGAVSQECDLTERNPDQLSCAKVLGNFLPTLGVSPVLGRNFLPEEMRPNGPDVALITYGLWRSRFNRDPSILNKLIDIDCSPVRVVGVLPEDFELPDLQPADVIRPLSLDESAQHTVNGGIGDPMRTFAQLEPDVNIEQARAEMEPLFQKSAQAIPLQFRNDFRRDFHLKIRSLRDRQMQDASRIAWILLGSVLAVLLIACANVASLLMARGAARQRDLAVRSALGASRARLARQALIEALLLSMAGAVAGFAFAVILVRVFIAIAPTGIPFLGKTHIDLRIIIFTVAVSLLCGALFGVVPALQEPKALMLTGRSLTDASHAAIRRWLVVAQIAASMVLLSGAMLLLHSFWNLQNQRLGMRTESTLTASITLGHASYATPERQMAFFQQLQTRFQYGPGVSSLAMSDSVPPGDNHLGHSFYSSLVVAGRPRLPGRTGGLVTSRWISPTYFRALAIPIVQGEGFRVEELNSSGHFIVLSRQLAERLFPGESAIGERLQLDNDGNPDTPWYTVVGVAANVKNGGLTGEEEPEYYTLQRNRVADWGPNRRRTEVFIFRTSLPPTVMSRWIRSQVGELDPIVLVNIETLNQRVSKMADRPRFEAALLGFFAFTGLMMAVIGLYGVISFVVTQRTHEVGVRMALGAQRGDILRMILREAGVLVMIGMILGIAAALATAQLIRSLLFHISPRDPLTLAVVCGVLVLTGLFAAWRPARRAASIDPMQALRAE